MSPWKGKCINSLHQDLNKRQPILHLQLLPELIIFLGHGYCVLSSPPPPRGSFLLAFYRKKLRLRTYKLSLWHQGFLRTVLWQGSWEFSARCPSPHKRIVLNILWEEVTSVNTSLNLWCRFKMGVLPKVTLMPVGKVRFEPQAQVWVTNGSDQLVIQTAVSKESPPFWTVMQWHRDTETLLTWLIYSGVKCFLLCCSQGCQMGPGNSLKLHLLFRLQRLVTLYKMDA